MYIYTHIHTHAGVPPPPCMVVLTTATASIKTTSFPTLFLEFSGAFLPYTARTFPSQRMATDHGEGTLTRRSRVRPALDADRLLVTHVIDRVALTTLSEASFVLSHKCPLPAS